MFDNSQWDDRKELEFYDLIDDVIGNNPKVVLRISSMENLQEETDASGAICMVLLTMKMKVRIQRMIREVKNVIRQKFM